MRLFYWRVRSFLNWINPWFQQERYEGALEIIKDLSDEIYEMKEKAPTTKEIVAVPYSNYTRKKR